MVAGLQDNNPRRREADLELELLSKGASLQPIREWDKNWADGHGGVQEGRIACAGHPQPSQTKQWDCSPALQLEYPERRNTLANPGPQESQLLNRFRNQEFDY